MRSFSILKPVLQGLIHQKSPLSEPCRKSSSDQMQYPIFLTDTIIRNQEYMHREEIPKIGQNAPKVGLNLKFEIKNVKYH